MSAVTRLVTFVDVDDQQPAGGISVSARHEAELADESRALLLDDRGWGSSGSWATTTVAEMHETARMVVGPDEPPDGRSYQDEEAAHWAHLQQILQQQGVVVSAAELKRLPHDVILSQRVLARIGSNPMR